MADENVVQRVLDETRGFGADLHVDAFVSHMIKLDDVNRGFELMEAQDGIRSAIDF